MKILTTIILLLSLTEALATQPPTSDSTVPLKDPKKNGVMSKDIPDMHITINEVAPSNFVDECSSYWQNKMPDNIKFYPREGYFFNRSAKTKLLVKGDIVDNVNGGNQVYTIMCALEDDESGINHLETYFFYKLEKKVKTLDGRTGFLKNPTIN